MRVSINRGIALARGSRSGRPLESVLCTVWAHNAEVAVTNENDKKRRPKAHNAEVAMSNERETKTTTKYDKKQRTKTINNGKLQTITKTTRWYFLVPTKDGAANLNADDDAISS